MVQAEDRTREREQTHKSRNTRKYTALMRTNRVRNTRTHARHTCMRACSSFLAFMADIIFCYSKVPILSLNCNLFNDRICTYMHIEFNELD